MHELFGKDFDVVDRLSSGKYQVEVVSFRKEALVNKYRIVRLEYDPSTPKHVLRKVLIGEFDEAKELVAVAKLILASETN